MKLLDKLIRQASEELNIPYDVCRRAYMSAWNFIHDKVQEPDLSIDTPIEEFRKYRLNFNIRGIGKLYVTEESFNRRNKKYLMILKYKQEHNDKSNEDD